MPNADSGANIPSHEKDPLVNTEELNLNLQKLSVSQLETTLLETRRLLAELNKTGLLHPHQNKPLSTILEPSPELHKLSISELTEWVKHYEKIAEELAEVKKERNEAKEKNNYLNRKLNDIKYHSAQLRSQAIHGEIAALESISSTIHSASAGNGHHRSPSDRGREKEALKKQGKVFRPRESRLTEMLEIRDFQTVYNIFVAVLLVMSASILWQNYFEAQSIVDFSMFYTAFGQLDFAAFVWGCMFTYACLSHFLWKNVTRFIPFNLLILFYASIQLGFLLAAGYACLSRHLPTASGFIVTLEACRIAMKVHSFFRTMLGLKLAKLEDSELAKKEAGGHTFNAFLYFFFAPTIIYRTSYPRTPYIRWTFVLARFSEVAMVILYTYVVMEKFGLPQVKAAATKPDSLKSFVISIFNCMIPGISIYLFCFFGLLHSWMNAWAEMLRFADRLFYKDWWNANSFAEFYRTWNTPVHDWLYNYIYVDVCEWLKSKRYSNNTAKFVAALVVIEFSAVVHEYAISCATGFFLPVLMFMFGGPGVFFSFMNPRRKQDQKHNIFFWAMLFIGQGLILMLYTREFYSRIPYATERDVTTVEYWKQFVTPYSWKQFFTS